MKSLIGKVVGGCQILGEIGQGGMGVIYRAKQLSLEREVALKVLPDRLAGDPKFVERFQREGRAIARVNHPNILAVYGLGMDPDLSLHYMIMELIDGRSLSEVLQEKGVLPPQTGADYIRQASLGLACAQGAGIIHRDIKPENIMVTKADVVKVSDFGLAKEVDAGAVTATDAVMGTPAYMSPEQCDGKTLDGRSDVYSLGGTFYRLITGRLPFEAETAMSMMYRHKHEPLTPPRQVVPTIPQAISQVIVKMMAKRREDRYETMEEVAKEIAEALAAPAGAPDAEGTMRVSGARVASPSVSVAGAADTVPVHPRRRELERLIAQGDARLRRGDLPGAVRLWREAKAIEDEPRIEERLQKHALPESEKNKKTGEMRIAEGKLSEAARAFRAAVELNPDDKDAAARLAVIEETAAKRREAVNQVRQLLASGRLEETVEAWDELPEEFRDESLERQVRQVRDVALPVTKLCDQADATMRDGELERGLGLFRRAADVDAENDRARRGVREAERRLGRIEGMLKEGYEFNVKENYERAIDSWSGILKVVPNHAQAKKLIIEARLRLGHGYRQKQGARGQAITQWKEILKVDPEHHAAQALLEEDVATQEGLSVLSEEAQTAFSRKKYSRAVACWREMLDIDPTNRKLGAAIEQASGLGRRRRLVRLVVLVVVVVLGGVGGEVTREWLALKRADELGRDNPASAAIAIETFEPRFLLLNAIVEPKRRSYMYQALFAEAGRRAGEREFEEAERLYRKAAEDYGGPGARDEIEMAVYRNDIAHRLHDAGEAEKAGRWAEALSHYKEARKIAGSQKFQREEQEAAEGVRFVSLVQDAFGAERKQDPDMARDLWRDAARLRPGHEAVKKAFQRLRIPE